MTKEEVSKLEDGVLSKMMMEYSRRVVDEQRWVMLECARRLGSTVDMEKVVGWLDANTVTMNQLPPPKGRGLRKGV
ncbi:MAG: hypothetical protein J6X18_00560 [Bacteroidales bacterium]|nr:hypothetical protein [Bacteroidales bacterium]